MSPVRTFVVALTLLGLAPAPARADGLLIPFAGVNFGGTSGREISNAIDAGRFDWGVSLAFMGGGVLGLEADIARSPDFFGRSDIGGSSVLTATGNLLIGIPFGGQRGFGFRPYAVGGLGVLRSTIDVLGDERSADENKFAWDFGGGVMCFFGTHVGLRGELRYFRTFDRLDFDIFEGVERSRRLDFGRASAGFIVRF
jgi:opacity protein-like surface antigen